jgi:glycerol kinase
MTLATQKAHVVRAFLEGIAFECRDILLAMQKDAKLQIRTVISDGGASKNDFFLEGMANTLGVEVQRPVMLEATALGSAFLAGLSVGFWKSKEELLKLRRIERAFSPFLDAKERLSHIQRWKRALKRSKGWNSSRPA